MCAEKSEIERERERVAYHEAGHVVVFLEYGWLFEYVTILHSQVSGDQANPHVHSPWLQSMLEREDFAVRELDKVIMIRLAGMASERVRQNDWGPLAIEDMRQLDWMRCRDLYEETHRISLLDATSTFYPLLKKVQNLLATPSLQRRVEAIAQELLKHGRRTGDQVREAIEAAETSPRTSSCERGPAPPSRGGFGHGAMG